MIQAVLRVVAPPGVREELLDVVRGLIGPTEVTKGCRACRAYCDVEDEDSFLYWMQWEGLDDLQEHFRSERFRRLLPYIEMSSQPPQVEITICEQLGGIEFIVAAIGSTVDAATQQATQMGRKGT